MFYEPSKGHGLPHDPVQGDRGAAADRLDIDDEPARRSQPRAILLLQRLLDASASRLVFVRWRQGQRHLRARDRRVRRQSGRARSCRADEPHRRRRAARRQRIRLCRPDASAVAAGCAAARRRRAGSTRVQGDGDLRAARAERRQGRRLRRHRRGGRHSYRRGLPDRRAVRHGQGRQRRATGLHGLQLAWIAVFRHAPASLGERIR